MSLYRELADRADDEIASLHAQLRKAEAEIKLARDAITLLQGQLALAEEERDTARGALEALLRVVQRALHG